MILSKMEATGGEPDVVGYEEVAGEYIIFDCSSESSTVVPAVAALTPSIVFLLAAMTMMWWVERR